MTELTDPTGSPTPAERWWAVARIALGQVQMIGAVVSLALLVGTGSSGLTVAAFALTCAALVVSRLMFRGR